MPILSPTQRDLRPNRRRKHAQAAAAATAACAAVVCVPGASASVISMTTTTAPGTPEHYSPVLFAPDGTSRRLPDLPLSEGPDDHSSFVSNAAGTLLAQPVGARLSLIPVDGGPVRAFTGTTQARVEFSPVVWWKADGSALATGPAWTTTNDRAIRRCTIATMSCRLDPIGDRAPVGALPDGRILEVSTAGALDPALAGAYTSWEARSDGWVRRQRRIVAARRTNKLWAEGGPGVGRTVLRDLSGRAVDGATAFDFVGNTPLPSSDGQLVKWTTYRLEVQTRTKDRKTQARVRRRVVRTGAWLVRPDATIRSIPRLAAARVDHAVAVPGQGWLGTRTDEDTHRESAVRISLDGRISPLRLAGGALTPQRLFAALGLPKDQRPPTGRENPDFVNATVALEGYEPATRSAVVSYLEPYYVVAARVPLDGGPPSLVERHRDSVTYIVR